MGVATSESVRLQCDAIVTWVDGQPAWIEPRALRHHRVGKPTWVQLALGWLSPSQRSWFAGSLDPWHNPDPPAIDWSHVDPVLETVGIGRADLESCDRELLERLPYLYGRTVVIGDVAVTVGRPDLGPATQR